MPTCRSWETVLEFWKCMEALQLRSLVPTGVLTPYNVQSTLHLKTGFFALLLPITVARGVSGIWCSYFAQRLFGILVSKLVLWHVHLLWMTKTNTIIWVTLKLSAWDLHISGEQLVKFLGSWRGNGRTLVEWMEGLCVALYEHHYIELHNVETMKLWLECLIDAG